MAIYLSLPGLGLVIDPLASCFLSAGTKGVPPSEPSFSIFF